MQPLTFPEGLTGGGDVGSLRQERRRRRRRDFVAASRNAALIAGLDPTARSLEGYLFPDTYTLARQADAASSSRPWWRASRPRSMRTLRAEAEAAGFTPRQVVTLASLIEKETAVGAERPLVAAVYRNRLRIGMLLQCDPTVIYGMMLAGRWRGNISRADLQMNSPYNTYRYPGLAARADRVARPRVARSRASSRRRAVPVFRGAPRWHAPVLDDARRTQPRRQPVAAPPQRGDWNRWAGDEDGAISTVRTFADDSGRTGRAVRGRYRRNAKANKTLPPVTATYCVQPAV